jgi:hypothetical protein
MIEEKTIKSVLNAMLAAVVFTVAGGERRRESGRPRVQVPAAAVPAPAARRPIAIKV